MFNHFHFEKQVVLWHPVQYKFDAILDDASIIGSGPEYNIIRNARQRRHRTLPSNISLNCSSYGSFNQGFFHDWRGCFL